MPIYEYRCTSCGRTVELLQRVADPPATECSHCQGVLEKLFSAPSFQFKGSGWYATDYAKGASGKASSDEGADSTTSKSSGSEATTKSGDDKASSESTASPSTGS